MSVPIPPRFILDPNSMVRMDYREFLLEIRVCKEQASLNTADHENYFAWKYLPFNKNRKETRAKIGRTLSSSIAIDSQNREILNHAQNPLKTEQRSSFFPIEREKRSRTADWFGIQGNDDKSDAKTKRGNVGDANRGWSIMKRFLRIVTRRDWQWHNAHDATSPPLFIEESSMRIIIL